MECRCSIEKVMIHIVKGFGIVSKAEVDVFLELSCFFNDGVSREVPGSALKGETVPDSLPATPKSPPTRRVPSWGYLFFATLNSF